MCWRKSKMLIKELIETLKEFNPNAEIKIYDDYTEYDDVELSYISKNENEDDKKVSNYVFLRGIQ